MTAPLPMPRPVPERPLGHLDIVDGAFAILRSRPRTVAAIAATFVLPVQLLSAWLNRELVAAFNFDEFNTSTGQFESQNDFSTFGNLDFGSPVTSALPYLVLPFLGVALTYLVLGWKSGQDLTAWQCLTLTAKKAHIILAVFVLGKIIQVVTLLFATPVLMLLAPIIAAENLGPLATIRRAFSLGRRRYGALFGLVLLIVLVNLLLTYALLTLPILGAALLGDWGWIAFFALSSVGTTVLNILGTGAAVLAYIDTRNRTEGTDIAETIRMARVRAG